MMDCYLCGRKSARLVIEVRGGDTYSVCGVCGERGDFCFTCDRPLRADDWKERFHQYSDDWQCYGCAEAYSVAYHESMVF